MPAGQNNTLALRWALEELRVVSGLPAAVLLLHQACAARSRARARGPLTAFADILIDMQVPPHDRATRRRHFHGIGRYPGTVDHIAAELNAEGTDYVLLPDDPPQAHLAPALEVVCRILAQSPEPLTRQEILARWPQNTPPPHPDSLCRSLAHACNLRLLTRTGAGTRAEAFRYGVERETCGVRTETAVPPRQC